MRVSRIWILRFSFFTLKLLSPCSLQMWIVFFFRIGIWNWKGYVKEGSPLPKRNCWKINNTKNCNFYFYSTHKNKNIEKNYFSHWRKVLFFSHGAMSSEIFCCFSWIFLGIMTKVGNKNWVKFSCQNHNFLLYCFSFWCWCLLYFSF